MKLMILVTSLLILISCSTTKTIPAEKLEQHVYWGSSESNELFNQSEAKEDFYLLSNNFRAQPNRVLCGPTSGSIVMNAFQEIKNHESLPKDHYDAGTEKEWLKKGFDLRIHTYTPYNFVNSLKPAQAKSWTEIHGMPKKGEKKDWGLQVRQLDQIFKSHGINSKLKVVSEEMKIEEFVKDLEKNLATRNDYIVINYKRSALGQKGGGHISPIAAYDKQTRRVLIMDVNPNKYPWVWVSAKDLFKSMQTFDTVENRGYVILSK
ncbi:phytochelatin synthase family protein [Bacteriovoracaceae bacterium]|nr:phytochelatin synthase family protein [Bacteriovoracaceae bacterium]